MNHLGKKYPLHIMNISSLQDFDAKVPKDDELKHLDVRRFRSNIIGKCYLT